MPHEQETLQGRAPSVVMLLLVGEPAERLLELRLGAAHQEVVLELAGAHLGAQPRVHKQTTARAREAVLR